MLSIGCRPNHTYQYFDFKDAVEENIYGIIKVGLRGEFVLVESPGEVKITQKGNPYRFWIWFKTEDERIEKVSVAEISIKEQNGETIKYSPGGSFPMSWSRTGDIFSGGWYIEGLNVNYTPLVVSLEVSIILESGLLKQDLTLTLFPNYREERKNDLWSRITNIT